MQTNKRGIENLLCCVSRRVWGHKQLACRSDSSLSLRPEMLSTACLLSWKRAAAWAISLILSCSILAWQPQLTAFVNY